MSEQPKCTGRPRCGGKPRFSMLSRRHSALQNSPMLHVQAASFPLVNRFTQPRNAPCGLCAGTLPLLHSRYCASNACLSQLGAIARSCSRHRVGWLIDSASRDRRRIEGARAVRLALQHGVAIIARRHFRQGEFDLRERLAFADAFIADEETALLAVFVDFIHGGNNHAPLQIASNPHRRFSGTLSHERKSSIDTVKLLSRRFT